MRTTLAIVSAVALFSIAGSATGAGLFDAPPDEGRARPSAAANASPPNRAVRRSSRVRLNRAYFHQKSDEIERGGTGQISMLELELPSGRTLRLRVGKTPGDRYSQAVRGRKPSRSHWSGRVEGEPESHATFIVDGERLFATVHSRGKVYQVRADDAGDHRVTEIDPALLPEEGEPLEAPQRDDEVPAGEPPPPAASNTAPPAGSETMIDLLVVYTDDAAEAVGTADVPDAIELEIDLALVETNDSYADSGIHQRLRLVKAARLDYSEQGSMRADLDALIAEEDGLLDDVHRLRDEAGADLVVLLTETGDNCGLAYTMPDVSVERASKGFAVVMRRCATGKYSFGHELGHLMAARHDRHADPTDGKPYKFNHGYVAPDHSWRTIMAYESACKDREKRCARLPRWSNPEERHKETPMGVAASETEAADNRSTLNATAETVSLFREALPEAPPPPPEAPLAPPVLLP